MKRDYYLPFYQGGGLVLPQYASGQLSYQVPNSGMATLNAMMQVDQQSFNRGIQMDQLNLQRSAQVGNMINTALNQQLQREQSVRATKQLDLANKQYELNLLKQGAEEQAKALAIGVNEFLPGDQAKIDADLAGINKKIADADPSDLNSFIRYGAEKRRILSTYTGAHANKKEYTDAMALFKDNPNSKLIDNALKGGYADLDVINTYADIEKEIYTNTQKFSETGDRQYLDRIKELAPQMKTLGDFINEDMKAQQDAFAVKKQEAELIKIQSQGELEKIKAEQELQDVNAYKQARETFLKENPNPTYDQEIEFRSKWNSKFSATKEDQINNLDELIARNVASGLWTMEQGVVYKRQMEGKDESSGGGAFFNQNTGRYDVKPVNGIKDYKGFKLNNNDEVVSMKIAGKTYNLNDVITTDYKDIVKPAFYTLKDGNPAAKILITIGPNEEDRKKAERFLEQQFGYQGDIEDFIRKTFPNLQDHEPNKKMFGKNTSFWIKNNVLTIPADKAVIPVNTNINSGFLNSGGSGAGIKTSGTKWTP